MAKKRKVHLVIELDADELELLPPHLRGLVQRPLVDPLQTRKTLPAHWPGSKIVDYTRPGGHKRKAR